MHEDSIDYPKDGNTHPQPWEHIHKLRYDNGEKSFLLAIFNNTRQKNIIKDYIQYINFDSSEPIDKSHNLYTHPTTHGSDCPVDLIVRPAQRQWCPHG